MWLLCKAKGKIELVNIFKYLVFCPIKVYIKGVNFRHSFFSFLICLKCHVFEQARTLAEHVSQFMKWKDMESPYDKNTRILDYLERSATYSKECRNFYRILLTFSIVLLIVYSFICLFVYSFIRLFVYSFIYSPNRLITYSCFRVFIFSCIQLFFFFIFYIIILF